MLAGTPGTSSAARLWDFATLARPANLVTAAADVLAGAAIAGVLDYRVAILVIASMSLYAGGVVLNDAFDAGLDATERPERPIPAGRVARHEAFLLGALLLLSGVVLAAVAGTLPAFIATGIALTAFAYDAWAKSVAWPAAGAMGLCRALNLLLGLALAPAVLAADAWVAVLSFAYVATLIWLGRGEVHGGTRSAPTLATLVAIGVAVVIAAFAVIRDNLIGVMLVGLYALAVLPTFVAAMIEPQASRLRRAVKSGVLALIVLDAALAAAFGSPLLGFAILALLPVSRLLARRFAVT